MSLIIGQKAPDFKLFNPSKEEIGLSAQAGKNVVLLIETIDNNDNDNC